MCISILFLFPVLFVVVLVIAVDQPDTGSALRMPGDTQAGNDVIEESKRKMGLLRLGRSRWGATGAEAEPVSAKRSMGLLRLGRAGTGTHDGDDDDEAEKRSMQLLRLGRRNDEDRILDEEPNSFQEPRQSRSACIKGPGYSSADSLGHGGHVPPHFYKWLGTGAP